MAYTSLKLENITDDTLVLYTDASYNGEDAKAGDTMNIGAGWAVSHKEKLVGHGYSGITVGSSTASDLAELRAMLAFLDLATEKFPDIISNNRIDIACDNSNLISMLRVANQQVLISLTDDLLRLYIAKYGMDFYRIVDYIASLKLNFYWVKGHGKNKFNRFADYLAGRSYKYMCRSKSEWPDAEREFWMKQFTIETNRYVNQLSALNAKMIYKRTFVWKRIMEYGLHPDMPVISIMMHKEKIMGNHVAAISYAGNNLQIKGGKSVITNRKVREDYLYIRALRNAMMAYRQCPQWNKNRLLIVRTSWHPLYEIVQAILHDEEISVPENDHRLAYELDKLKELMQEVRVAVLSDTVFKKSPGYLHTEYHRKHAVKIAHNHVELVKTQMKDLQLAA